VPAPNGRHVDFIKTYDGTGGARHSVRYSGVVDNEGNEIHGRWHISHRWSGKFLMIRDSSIKALFEQRIHEPVIV
jgi:hypothetical protein